MESTNGSDDQPQCRTPGFDDLSPADYVHQLRMHARYCRRQGFSDTEAEDSLHDGVVAILIRKKSEPIRQPLVYWREVSRRKTWSYVDERKKAESIYQSYSQYLDNNHTIARVQQAQLRFITEFASACLNRRERALLRLVYLEGRYTLEQLPDIWGCSYGYVKNVNCRLKSNLRIEAMKRGLL